MFFSSQLRDTTVSDTCIAGTEINIQEPVPLQELQ